MERNNRKSLSDTPFKEYENDLGTEHYVKGLIKFIENSSAPITIALQGEWGSGKTSMMIRLEKALCSAADAPFIGVDINTWEYSMMSTPEQTVYKIIARLVHELSKGDSDTKTTFKKFLRGAGNFLYRGAREGLKTIPTVGGMIAVGLEAANVPHQLAMTSEDNETATLAELKDALERTVRCRIENERKRGVIIFVDDLDRLNPPIAVEILELLKNVFTIDNCIFVLAIDYEVVVKGLKPKYGRFTDKNEREFRSFFDKIIQVPFSLPVNSYKPIDFMLKALVEIGYLKDDALKDSNVKTCCSSVLDFSVRNNPRSIKRLINTLSLLDCIASECGSTSQQDKSALMNEKVLTLIIVAIQVCYPKIYRLLEAKPAFMDWDKTFAHKEGIVLSCEQKQENQERQENQVWEDILEAACATDKYLTQRMQDIHGLFSLIIEIIRPSSQNCKEEIGMKLKQILDKSSVTGVNTDFNAEDFDKKDFICKLHNNVIERMRTLCPDIKKCDPKRNTGNGGMRIWIDDVNSLDVTFTPGINSKNEITLRLWLDLRVERPDRMTGMPFDELLKDECLSSSLKALDSVLSPLLKSAWFNGRIYDGCSSYFPSFTDELRYLHKMDWTSGGITIDPMYWINLKKPSDFEDSRIVDTIANLLIANYDFRISMKDFK